jgi:hypothetical protein
MINMLEYSKITNDHNIHLVYNGPMREEGVKSFAGALKAEIEKEVVKGSAAKAIFSVFIEQMTNILMYSVETVTIKQQIADIEEIVSKGILAFGAKDDVYFIQTGNAMKTSSIEKLKAKIDHVNSLDKKELRSYQKERLKADNKADNPESKGAGIGLIEVARRACSPIQYSFEPYGTGDDISYFSLYVEVSKKSEKKEEQK